MAKKKKASQKGRKPFKRNVKNITKDLNKEENPLILLEDEIKEEIVLEKGIFNFNWVSRTYNISIAEAKELVIKANRN